MTSFTKWKRGWSHLRSNPLLVAESFLALMSIQVRLLFFSKHVMKELSALQASAEGPAHLLDDSARAVHDMVERVAKCLPLESHCLCVAMAVHFLLLRRGIRCSMRLGVQTKDRGQLQAHAWIEGLEAGETSYRALR